MRKHVPLAVIVATNAILTVIAMYALQRAHDVFFANEPNPATIIRSAHVAMFWRLAVGAYAAGIVSVIVFTLARRRLARATRVTAALALVVGAIIAAQGALLP